ncbi:AroK Shikimate kinase [Candidatus Nanopelagicaceae bacterium]
MAPRIILIGPMGSGKTTVGTALAAHLGIPFRDTDEMIVAQSGREISDIFIEDGEDEFRALEKIILRTALLEDGTVLSLGGGACVSFDAQSALRASGAFIVYLKISLSQVSSRVGFNQGRPLLMGNPRAQWQNLMNERAPIYEGLAHFISEVDGRTVEDLVQEIAIAADLRSQGSIDG